MSGVRDYPIAMLKHNVVALAKAAKALKLPIVVTTTVRDGMWGLTIPELVEVLPGHGDLRPFVGQRLPRSTRRARHRGCRPKESSSSPASLWKCAQLIRGHDRVGKGFDAYVPVDLCGTSSETKRQAGILRMVQGGVVVSDYCTWMVKILKDNLVPEAGPVYEAMDWAKRIGQVSAVYAKK